MSVNSFSVTFPFPDKRILFFIPHLFVLFQRYCYFRSHVCVCVYFLWKLITIVICCDVINRSFIAHYTYYVNNATVKIYLLVSRIFCFSSFFVDFLLLLLWSYRYYVSFSRSLNFVHSHTYTHTHTHTTYICPIFYVNIMIIYFGVMNKMVVLPIYECQFHIDWIDLFVSFSLSFFNNKTIFFWCLFIKV